MPQCRMVVENNRQCGDYLFKCKHCGSAGCANKKCKNQQFDSGNGMCLSCNGTSARVSL